MKSFQLCMSNISIFPDISPKNVHSSFAWQRSFFEQIIRDRKPYDNISDYIITNPARWEQDKFYNYEQ